MREISIIKQRILQFIEYKGISKYEFYKKTGVSNGVLSQESGISEEYTLRFLSHYPEINPTWLLTGKGDMLLTGPVPSNEVYQITDVAEQGPLVKRLFPDNKNEDYLVCKSDNEAYPPFSIPKTSIRSVAIAVGVIRLE